jgi:hypothetical protein
MTRIRKEEEWQRLCELVANETDPRRLSKLVDQLIEKLDAHKQALRRKKRWRSQLGPRA